MKSSFCWDNKYFY